MGFLKIDYICAQRHDHSPCHVMSKALPHNKEEIIDHGLKSVSSTMKRSNQDQGERKHGWRQGHYEEKGPMGRLLQSSEGLRP